MNGRVFIRTGSYYTLPEYCIIGCSTTSFYVASLFISLA